MKRYSPLCLLAVAILFTSCATGQTRDRRYPDEAKPFIAELPSETSSVETSKVPVYRKSDS